MQRYFVEERYNNVFVLNKEDTHHVIDVMRMNIGEKIEIVYNNSLYIAKIVSMNTKVECQLIKECENIRKETPRVIIAQSLVKEQKMDYILQKSCELGVDEIIPISTDRSIIKIDKNDNKKILRWNKILKEASEQSKRVTVPNLREIINLKDLINVNATVKLLCTVNEKSKTIKSILSNVNISDTIIFVIGSEGGFSQNEEEYLMKNGFIPVSLGQNVLRTETVSSFIQSIVNYEFMR